MGKEKSSLVDNINARWTEDGIYVEMPEELKKRVARMLKEADRNGGQL